jgi:hypothetical protein
MQHQYSATGSGSDYGTSSRYIDLDRGKFGIAPPPLGDEMKYRVITDGLKIRSGAGATFPEIGQRTVGEVVTPLETKGDQAYPGAYWARDSKGWSAVQYYSDNRYLMEPFV